jgi:hypothetical protein
LGCACVNKVRLEKRYSSYLFLDLLQRVGQNISRVGQSVVLNHYDFSTYIKCTIPFWYQRSSGFVCKWKYLPQGAGCHDNRHSVVASLVMSVMYQRRNDVFCKISPRSINSFFTKLGGKSKCQYRSHCLIVIIGPRSMKTNQVSGIRCVIFEDRLQSWILNTLG